MKMLLTLHKQMTSSYELMEKTKTMQAMRTTIQNKATARTQKTRKTMTATTTTMMERMLQK